MLGATIDYYLLRPFTHDRNLATEEQLNAAAKADAPFDIASATAKLRRLNERCDNRLVARADLRYLDVGCGRGEIALALAHEGAGHVAGVDILARTIDAASHNAKKAGLIDRVDFVCQDIHRWEPDERFDVVISREAMEHIDDPAGFLRRLVHFVKPGGIAVLLFGPLFHSPIGDHMWGFFRCHIPWRGVLFNEQAILRLRRERFRPTDSAERYRDIAGGLNQMRYSEFLRYVHDAGWGIDFLSVNPQLRRYPLLGGLSDLLVRARPFRDYFAGTVCAVLRRTDTAP